MTSFCCSKYNIPGLLSEFGKKNAAPSMYSKHAMIVVYFMMLPGNV
jgi:hypothetical protein